MLEDAGGIRRVVLACGFVDLRKGIDGLAQIIGSQYDLNPFEKGTLFLFCGRRSDRMKGLLWMGSGFLLLYKRFEDGSLAWPRTTQEAADITQEQFRILMLGLNPLDPKIKGKRQTMRSAYINAPLFSGAVYDILREAVLTKAAALPDLMPLYFLFRPYTWVSLPADT